MPDLHDLSWLPEQELQRWVVEQRWFASKSREVTQLNVTEAVPLRSESLKTIEELDCSTPTGRTSTVPPRDVEAFSAQRKPSTPSSTVTSEFWRIRCSSSRPNAGSARPS